MRKTSGKVVGEYVRACGKTVHFPTCAMHAKTPFTQQVEIVLKFYKRICTRLCTWISCKIHLFEQLLYPTSTALIIRTIII
jgi:hypothetical protein